MVDNNIAFVAMKFTDLPWKDTRYQILAEALKEAGYEPLRADEIRSSGAIVDEVCRLLETARLVVIDSTGDSHSVSYEIGYCHGCKRPVESVILLREAGSAIPFNYRHYRHVTYKNLSQLKKVLRERLGISALLSNDAYGYCCVFRSDCCGARSNTPELAMSILDVLHALNISGRVELYSDGDFSLDDSGRLFRFAVGVKLRGRKGIPNSFEWWLSYRSLLTARLHHYGVRCELSDDSEISEMRAIRIWITHDCTLELDNGKVSQIWVGESDNDAFSSPLYCAIKELVTEKVRH